MKRPFLSFLIALTLLPILLVTGIAGVALYGQQNMARKLAEAYSKNLVETLAERLPEGRSGMGMGASSYRGHGHRMRGQYPHPFLSQGFGTPGWVAQLSRSGELLRSSPGAVVTPEILAALGKIKEDESEAISLTLDSNGVRHAVSILPANGYFYIAAVSWERLYAANLRPSLFQPALLFIAFMGTFVSLIFFWKWVLSPLQELFQNTQRLNLGKEPLKKSTTKAVMEIEKLREAVEALALSAVGAESLKRSYVSDIVRTQESERVAIAQDLHDGALQAASAVSQRIQLALRGLQKGVGDAEKISSHLHAAQEATDFSIQEMRTVCDTLSPPWISLGLLSTLDEVSNRLSKSYAIAVLVNAKPLPLELPSDRVLALCRIVQEGVANAVRHGKASRVTVDVFADTEALSMRIKDNGIGFSGELDPQQLRLSGHRGLSGMAERMSMFGGQFCIHSTEMGVEISVQLPYPTESTHLPGDGGS